MLAFPNFNANDYKGINRRYFLPIPQARKGVNCKYVTLQTQADEQMSI